MEKTEIKYNICQNCILINGSFGVQVNSNGFCSYCTNPHFETPTWRKVVVDKNIMHEKLEDWNKTVNRMSKIYGNKEYCCVFGYSGGKDSTALLDTFIDEYQLRPYLITIDTGFMTDVAKKNIKDTLAKMGLEQDHKFIEGAIPTFTKLYKYFFLDFHPDPNGKALTAEICHTCTDLIHTILVKEAINLGLKYVIIGFSPDQIARYFYEIFSEEIFKDGIPHPKHFKQLLDRDDLVWYLDKHSIVFQDLPRVLYPYHVIPYDENEIIHRIQSKGLIEVGKGDPVLTNCHVVKAGLFYDFYRFGSLPYALQYAELIRQKDNEIQRQKSRKEWIRVITRVGRNIADGRFDAEGMNALFRRIGSSRQEIINIIQHQIELDPNKEQILKNIELYKNGKLK